MSAVSFYLFLPYNTNIVTDDALTGRFRNRSCLYIIEQMSGSKNSRPLGATAHKHGVTFRVWAPFANSVAVTGSFNNWQHAPMQQDGAGYWSADIPGAEPGQEYKFVIKNGDKELYKNDPYAKQLTTTNGNSVIVDQDFEWSQKRFTPAPQHQQVLYELHIGTFSRADPATVGTFDEAIEKLDYLRDLGITTIELMPVNSMVSDRGWGYAPDYIHAVESLYGGRRGLLEFVDAAHQKGMAVILDVVYNHFGPGDGLDIWQFDGWHENDKGGIYFYNDWRSATPWGDTRPDYGRPEVQDYILDNVKMWLTGFRLDGLRLDSTIFIRNVQGHDNDPGNDLPDGWHLMQRINALGNKINPNSLMIAEDTGSNQFLTETAGYGGAGFKAQWEITFPEALRSVLNPAEDHNRNLEEIYQQLTKSFNGDAFRRIVYSDSHDTAANGAARLAEQITPGNPTDVYARKRNLLASTLVLTAPGIPMLFQGQEFNEGGSFNDWQELDWEKSERHKGILEAHRHLIALRRNLHSHTAGLSGQHTAILHVDWDNRVLAYHRWDKGGTGDDVVIIVNFSNKTLKDYQLPLPRSGEWQVRFNSGWSGYSSDFKDVPLEAVEVAGNSGSVDLAPYSALILSQD